MVLFGPGQCGKSTILNLIAGLERCTGGKITVDGEVSKDELEDFIYIQEELERISIAVETLQLWSERMLATGVIDVEQYKALKRK